MLGIDEPLLDRGVQVPKEMSSLSTNALLAGVVEAVMDGLGFVSRGYDPSVRVLFERTILESFRGTTPNACGGGKLVFPVSAPLC